MSSEKQHDLTTFYGELSASCRAVDEFRMKLLGLLPVATGTGAFILLSNQIGAKPTESLRVFLGAIGTVGFMFTVGLFAYELHGIKKCHSYIFVGRWIETAMKVPGQFVARPRALGGCINEPFASAVIYPASLGAWAFTATVFVSSTLAAVIAVVVFIPGFGITLWIAQSGSKSWDRELDTLLSDWMARRPSPPPKNGCECRCEGSRIDRVT